MKTRLFVVLFCLVWALGCGNRDPEDVETGFGRLETATLRICNNSNCVGGAFDDEECVDDSDCGAGGPSDPQCEIFVPFKECFGGSADPRTPCETDLECGSACDAGGRLGSFCRDDSDCMVCMGGSVPQPPQPCFIGGPPTGCMCDTREDCGGVGPPEGTGGCRGGTVAAEGAPCLIAKDCGGICVGGRFDGRTCSTGNSEAACISGMGVCNVDGVTCELTGECIQSGDCVPGECNQVSEGCVNAQQILAFTGVWDSCLNLDSFLSGPPFPPPPGTTLPAVPMRMDGPPVEINVAGCNSATLDLSFEFNGVPSPGCVGIEFTSGDLPSLEQCGETVQMEIDFR